MDNPFNLLMHGFLISSELMNEDEKHIAGFDRISSDCADNADFLVLSLHTEPVLH